MNNKWLTLYYDTEHILSDYSDLEDIEDLIEETESNGWEFVSMFVVRMFIEDKSEAYRLLFKKAII